MKINTSKILPEGLEISENCAAEILDLNSPNLKFNSPLRIKAKITKIMNVVSVQTNISAQINFVCSRCLVETNSILQRNFRFDFPIEKEEQIIDLDEDIRQEIVLDYPIKLLCKPDCQGLCPKCGKDLNQGLCGCK